MSKTWVLDTETKGTGATMVPLEKRARPARTRERGLELVQLGGRPREPRPAAAPEPARYRVVDLLSATVLAEDAPLREAVRALEGVRSVLDVSISMWAPERERWRLLTLDERKALWGFRGRVPAEPQAEPA